MRWSDLRRSSNVEDRRRVGSAVALGGGGIGTILIVIAILLCGGDPSELLQSVPTEPQVQPPGASNSAAKTQDQNEQFARAILGSLEDTWRQVLPQQARIRYQDPRLVLFSGQVASACGYASAATGPFYCPGDSKLYLDFSFFNDLAREFKAPGDFAQAYVIAHEFGHHIQNLTGVMEQVQRRGQNNRLSVALELQADCYAGVWAYHMQQQRRVETGDAEEAIRATAAVGDDLIQKRTQGYVVPESFTHGSAKQRMEWFSRGMRSGDMRQCNTFGS